MTETRHSLDLTSGRLSWVEIGAGEPLVMLHGWSMSHAVFNELRELLKADYRLLIPDLPGHGGSAATQDCSLKGYADVVSAWLETLGIQRADILGWSLGGQVALQMAVDHPQQVERLLLLSSTPRFCAVDDWSAGLPEGELRALKRGLRLRYHATLGDFFNLQFEEGEISSQRRQEILRFAVRAASLPDPAVAARCLDLLGQEDLRSGLAGIKQPTLVLHGAEDKIIPAAAGRYLADKIPAAIYRSLEGVGHAPFLSRPKLVADAVREFLE